MYIVYCLYYIRYIKTLLAHRLYFMRARGVYTVIIMIIEDCLCRTVQMFVCLGNSACKDDVKLSQNVTLRLLCWCNVVEYIMLI